MTNEITKIYIAGTSTAYDICDSKARDHINTSEIHIAKTDRDRWNNKSDFSGNYNDLINKPTGKLTIGNLVYDGSEDVNVPVYDGSVGN